MYNTYEHYFMTSLQDEKYRMYLAFPAHCKHSFHMKGYATVIWFDDYYLENSSAQVIWFYNYVFIIQRE